MRKHNEEPLVAAATANLVRKNECLRNIANQGIYKHNIEVLRQNDGILMVARAPATRRTAADFLPCEFCLQFFVKRELYRHCTECKFRMPDAPIDGFVASGRNLLDGSINGNSNIGAELAEQVISRMRIDKVTSIVKTDTLILQLGELLLRKLGSKRALDISAHMRELGRLIIRLQSDESVKERTLNPFISGRLFDKVMEGIEAEGIPETSAAGRKLFKKPAFVIKVNNSLWKVAQLKRGKALREGDKVCTNEEGCSFEDWRSSSIERSWGRMHDADVSASLRLKLTYDGLAD